jgi:hypothetical protein
MCLVYAVLLLGKSLSDFANPELGAPPRRLRGPCFGSVVFGLATMLKSDASTRSSQRNKQSSINNNSKLDTKSYYSGLILS